MYLHSRCEINASIFGRGELTLTKYLRCLEFFLVSIARYCQFLTSLKLVVPQKDYQAKKTEL